MTRKPDIPPPLMDEQEKLLIELYRRMRKGQKDMFRELAEVMVNRTPALDIVPEAQRRDAGAPDNE